MNKELNINSQKSTRRIGQRMSKCQEGKDFQEGGNDQRHDKLQGG